MFSALRMFASEMLRSYSLGELSQHESDVTTAV